MPSAVRLGDICTGHDSCPPRNNASASPNVYINNRGSHRVGDVWVVHCTHGSNQASGSHNVYVNNRQQARVGDSIACGSNNASGSHNVYVNG